MREVCPGYSRGLEKGVVGSSGRSQERLHGVMEARRCIGVHQREVAKRGTVCRRSSRPGCAQSSV